MLEKIKLALRIRTSVFDDEIIDLIESCKTDLIRSGLNLDLYEESHAGLLNCIISYVKWQFNFQSNGNEWEKTYNKVKTSLVLEA